MARPVVGVAALFGTVLAIGGLVACGTTKTGSHGVTGAAAQQAVEGVSGSPAVTSRPSGPSPTTVGGAAAAAAGPAAGTGGGTAKKASAATAGGGGKSAAGSRVPAASAAVARLNPSSAQVMQAVRVLQSHIPFFHITEAQARDFGNQVCTAFDQGQAYAQVKATVQQKLSRVPLVHVSSSDVDYAIRTAVSLFCPGYASKLP